MVNFLIGAKMNTETIVMLVLLAIMVVVLVVLPMFTNKRRNKAINDLHSSLRPGDVIKTVGGIVGKIVEIKEISPVDREMVVETGVGDNKTTMVFDIQAVYQVLSKTEAPVASTPFNEVPAAEVAEEPVKAEEAVPAEAVEAPVAQEQKTEEAATATPAAPKKPRSGTKK